MERNQKTNPPSATNSTGRNSEPYLGGADAVEKTSAVGDVHGAGPVTPTTPAGDVNAAVRSGRGLGVLGWVVVLLVAIVAIVYLAGIFT